MRSAVSILVVTVDSTLVTVFVPVTKFQGSTLLTSILNTRLQKQQEEHGHWVALQYSEDTGRFSDYEVGQLAGAQTGTGVTQFDSDGSVNYHDITTRQHGLLRQRNTACASPDLSTFLYLVTLRRLMDIFYCPLSAQAGLGPTNSLGIHSRYNHKSLTEVDIPYFPQLEPGRLLRASAR